MIVFLPSTKPDNDLFYCLRGSFPDLDCTRFLELADNLVDALDLGATLALGRLGHFECLQPVGEVDTEILGFNGFDLLLLGLNDFHGRPPK
jgi:hypothetical protein